MNDWENTRSFENEARQLNDCIVRSSRIVPD